MKSGSSQNLCWQDAYGQDGQPNKAALTAYFNDSKSGDGMGVLGEWLCHCLVCLWRALTLGHLRTLSC